MVLHGAIRTSARSLLRLATEREFRRVSALSLRFALTPRRKPGHVRIDGREFRFPDAASFLSAYEEIFADRIYAFEARSEEPFILDLGANVGLSVLFFKRLYPRARVVALEPDPEVFRYLQENVASLGLEGVTLHNAAVWTEAGELTFAPDGADGGRVNGQGGGLRVPALGICQLMGERPIDFLKMDIEGAENDVLPAAAHLLPQVRNVFVEYHSPAGQPQRLDRLIDALAGAGFRIALATVKTPGSPFLPRPAQGAFDLQVNVSGFRP
jgi:FkbM family methyltransferase